MVLFKDLNKASNDVLTKDFVDAKPWEFEVKSASGNFTFTQLAALSGSALDASSTVKHANKDASVETKFFVNGNSSYDVKYTLPKYVQGLVLNAHFDHKKNAKHSAELSGEYAGKTAHGKVTFNPLAKQFGLTAVVNYHFCKLGAEVSGCCTDIANTKYHLGGSYSKDGLTTALKTSFDGKSLTSVVGAAHVKNGKTEIGSELTYNATKGDTSLVFGGKYAVDEKTAVRAKLASNARATFGVTHAFSPLLTGNFGVSFDASNPVAPDAVKYGVKFAFTQ